MQAVGRHGLRKEKGAMAPYEAVVGGHQHTTTTTTTTSGDGFLFSTDISNNVIELKNVILNEFHVLRKFCLISLCNEALSIQLNSDLGLQIGFQLNNENLDNEIENSNTEPTVATFLADDFNQLFNTVNLVSEVVLQPRQVQQVIISFRPNEVSNDMPKPARDYKEKDDRSPTQQRLLHNGHAEPSKRVYSSANQTFHVHGKLFLSATVLSENRCGRDAKELGSQQQQHQVITVDFNSTVCRSTLKTDVSEIVFEDCVPGGVFVKDFSIWNISEIPCTFQLCVKNVAVEHPILALTDYDTGLPVSDGEIKSCAHRRIRVTYKPRDVGDFSYFVQLDNMFDSRNSKSIPIQCLVNPEQQQEGLLVTGVGEDGVLDFGACYSGNGTCQMLTLRNITPEALVVNLGSDYAPGDQLAFYRQTDLDLLSPDSKARLKDVVSYDEDGVLDTDEARAATVLLDKLGNSISPSVRLNKKSRVEVISLGRGEEKNLLVWLYPAGASDELKAARLQRRSFRISLKCAEKKGYTKQRFSKIIQCKAQVCTSIVKLSSLELNFGDCNIGSAKSSSVQILNRSDLPALVSSYVTSTIISLKSNAERVSIPPGETHSLDIDLVPLKTNLKYRKQIRVDNLFNKDNNQVLEVRAKIMDHHHVLFHSLFYKLKTPSSNNFLDFDGVVVNNPSVKLLSVENITDKKLTLGFNTSMPEELGIYQLKDESLEEDGILEFGDTCSLVSEGSEEDYYDYRKRAYAASVNKEKILETLEESQPRLSKAIVDSAPFPVQQGHAKTMPPRHPFSTSDKRTRIRGFDRMSLDLGTSRLSSNMANNALEAGALVPVAIPGQAKSQDDSAANVKPFSSSAPDHSGVRSLKRAQSHLMLGGSGTEDARKNVRSPLHEDSSPEECIADVLNRLGSTSLSSVSLTDDDAVKKYIDDHIRDRELTVHALEDGPRILSTLGRLELLPGESKNLFVVLVVDGQSHSSLQGRLQQLEAKVTIELLDYDTERQEHMEPGFLEHAMDEDLLTRELPVQIKVCRALLSLAQKNISFGKMLTNEHRAKTLVLNNIADVPLLYKIKKTGSIASGDLHIIDGRTGVLKAHSSQEVNFVFQPSLSGTFQETLTVSNVYDPSNDQVVTLKATISRAETFWLNTSDIDFGAMISGQWSTPQSVLMLNTSKQTRTFMLKELDLASAKQQSLFEEDFVATELPAPKLRFLVEPKKLPSSDQIPPEQEAIEALERKLLAYKRKGKKDKAAKVQREIDELRCAKESASGVPEKDEERRLGEVQALDNGAMTASDIELDHVGPWGSGDPVLGTDNSLCSNLKESEGFTSFILKAGDSQVVLVSCFASLSEATSLSKNVHGAFVAYESKNQDVVKQIDFKATICSASPDDEGSVSRSLKPVQVASSPYSLSAPTPSLSPDSSAPNSPSGGQTPKSGAGGHPLQKTSSSNLSSSNDGYVVVLNENLDTPPGPSHTLSTDLGQALETTSTWDSGHHVMHWQDDLLGPLDGCFDPSSMDDSSNGASQVESLGSLSTLEPLFAIELLQPATDNILDPVLTVADDDMDLSSAAALARSLSLLHHLGGQQDICMLDKEKFAGEVVLEDYPDGEKMEASFLLRSLCAHDIWIQFQLLWDRQLHELELWVGDFDFKVVGDGTVGWSSMFAEGLSRSGALMDTASSSFQPTKLLWQRVESRHSEASGSIPMLVTSAFLKGTMAKWVTLRVADNPPPMESWDTSQIASAENGGTWGWGEEAGHLCGGVAGSQRSGVLTLQSQPDERTQRQLLVCMKQPERVLKVSPSEVIFPESELSSVLTTDFSIKNRTGHAVDYSIKVSGPTLLTQSSCRPNNKLQEGSTLVANTSVVTWSAFTRTTQANSPLESIVSVSPMSGLLKPHESAIVRILCKPVRPGKQMYTLHIKSSLCLSDSEINITLEPCRVHFLQLPDLQDGNLDMGFCFINAPGNEKIVPIKLYNNSTGTLSLSFRSNLTKQVHMSLDPNGWTRTDEMELAPRASRTVFLCLRPGGDSAAYKNGQCREIVGGMRVTALSSEHAGAIMGGNKEGMTDQIMLKFRAMVGQSLMKVSTSQINLGRLKEIGGCLSGHFVVSNPSAQMPLSFSLSSRHAMLSCTEGYLVGKEVARTSNDTATVSEIVVEFQLRVTDYGLIEDTVIVKNMSCPGQNAAVIIQVYVDGGLVEAQVEPALSHFELAGTEVSMGDMGHKIRRTQGCIPGMPPSLSGDSSRDSTQVQEKETAQPMQRAAAMGAKQHNEGITNMSWNSCRLLEDNSCLDLGTVFTILGTADRSTAKKDSSPDKELKEFPDLIISDLRPYHASLLITNHSAEAVTLQPVSSLPVVVNVDVKYATEVSHGISAHIQTGGQCGSSLMTNGSRASQSDCVDPCCTILSQEHTCGLEEAAHDQVHNMWVACGHAFTLAKGGTARLFVACRGLNPLSASDSDQLQKGRLCAFEGLLAFCKTAVRTYELGGSDDGPSSGWPHANEDWQGSQVVEIVSVRGSMCLSFGEVVTKFINLGKVGDANGWDDVTFEFTIKNLSDAVLLYNFVDVPGVFTFASERLDGASTSQKLSNIVAPRSLVTIQALFHASKLEQMKVARTWSWKVQLVNCNNPLNLMELALEADMTVRNLCFGALTGSVLLLPPITVPAPLLPAPCTTNFIVQNLSLESLGVALELHQVEDSEALVVLEVTTQKHGSVRELTLQPGEKAELCVGARLISDSIPHALKGNETERPNGHLTSFSSGSFPETVFRPLLGTLEDVASMKQPLHHENQHATIATSSSTLSTALTPLSSFPDSEHHLEIAGTVCLGHLYLYSSPQPDCISIHGTLLAGPVFDVSPHTLQLQAKFMDTGAPSISLNWPEAGVDFVSTDPFPRVEKDFKGGRLGAWEIWHDKSGTVQKIVVQNLLAFDSLQFKVQVEDVLTDEVGTVFHCLEVQPQEANVAPTESVEVVVKPLPWSTAMYDAFLKLCSEGLMNIEYLSIVVTLRDIEKRDSGKRIEILIKPPTFPQRTTQKELNLETQKQVVLEESADKTNNGEHVKGPPVLGLRGCTPVGGSTLSYKFDLGQQNISAGGHLHWDLTLVGDKEWPISYCLCTISSSDASWLSISSCFGVVEALQLKTVKLSFSTKALGVYSTYLMVENLENPGDLKTVHLSMEVVASRNIRPEAPSLSLFHVLVQGDKTEEGVIDMGEVYYNFWYRNRSFVVVNEAAVAMEFLLSSSLDHNDSIELNFSLANSSLKRFSSVTVDAKSSIRLWIHFCPGRAMEKHISEDTCDEISATIFVNCRLVKDYQRCIPFQAKCRYPQIGISSTDLVFSTRRQGVLQGLMSIVEDGDIGLSAGPVNAPFIENVLVQELLQVPHNLGLDIQSGKMESSTEGVELDMTPVQSKAATKVVKDEELELVPPVQALIIKNLYIHQKLEYIVKNDSLFFQTDCPEPQVIPARSAGEGGAIDLDKNLTQLTSVTSQAFHSIVVRPNPESLRLHRKMILKQKYVEEHMTVYNRFNPREKYTVSLRITAGHLRNFFAAPGPKNSYPFGRLELAITWFISRFNSLMSGLLEGLQHKSLSRQRSAAQMTNITGELKSSNNGFNKMESQPLLGQSLKKQQEYLNQHTREAFEELEECLGALSAVEDHSQRYGSLFFDFQYLTDELVFYSLKERWSRGGATLELGTVQLAKLLYCALFRCQIFHLCLDGCSSFTKLKACRFFKPEDLGLQSRLRLNAADGLKINETKVDKPSEGRPKELDHIPKPPKFCLKFVEDWTGQLRHFLSFFPDSRDDLLPLRDLNQNLQEVIISCRATLEKIP